jgi:hypothetical protein
MRKVIIALCLHFCVAGIVFADSPTLLFSLSDSTLARIGVINEYDFSLRLRILTEDGTAIFSEKINEGETYFKFYDLSALPSGTYFIRVVGKNYKDGKSFHIENGKVVLNTSPGTLEPTFEIKHNQLHVLLNNHFQQSVSLTIRDNSTVLYQELAIDDLAVNKTINLNGYPNGSYILTVKSTENLFNYEFNVN